MHGNTTRYQSPVRKPSRAALTDAELAVRRRAMETRGANAYQPGPRTRQVSRALEAYAAMTTSASRGAVRDVRGLRRVTPAGDRTPVGA